MSGTKNFMKDEENSREDEVDVLKLKERNLNNDLYTLYWASLNKDIWDQANNDEENKGVILSLTNSNRLFMKASFVFFVIVLFFTLGLIIYQVFTTEINVYCSVQITILRVLLSLLVQTNLTGELRESLVKWKYTHDNPDKFYEPFTAKFIAACQFFVALCSYIALLLFICTENTPIDMIMDFTGIVVFVELDDWIGSHICSNEPNFNSTKLEYYKNKLDENLPFYMKLSKLQNYTLIIEDTNTTSFAFILSLFSHNRLYLIVIPFSVLIIEKLFKEYHPYVNKP